MLISSMTTALDWLGIIVFAISGALVAARKRMDIVGFMLLGTVTGIGGGTLRDLILDRDGVFWVERPEYLLVCCAVSVAVFFSARFAQSRYRLLLWFDALGLSIFAVTGAERAIENGAGAVVAIAMGMTTACFGGIIRDVLGNETPAVLRSEIYVTAAFVGAAVFTAGVSVFGAQEGALVSGFLACLLVRGVSLQRGWSLPRYGVNAVRTRTAGNKPM